MKCTPWFLVLFSLLVVSGCSSENGAAKKLIIEAFDRSTALQFVEFTRFDDKNGCYEVQVRNYDGRGQTVFVALQKESASGEEWNRLATAQSIEDCRSAIK